jgi:hypothetical protein
MVETLVQIPRLKGEPFLYSKGSLLIELKPRCKAGDLDLLFWLFLPFLIN